MMKICKMNVFIVFMLSPRVSTINFIKKRSPALIIFIFLMLTPPGVQNEA